MNQLLSRIRPQIFMSIVCGTTVAIVISILAYKMGSVAIITGVIGSVFGYLAGVSAKILENE